MNNRKRRDISKLIIDAVKPFIDAMKNPKPCFNCKPWADIPKRIKYRAVVSRRICYNTKNKSKKNGGKK